MLPRTCFPHIAIKLPRHGPTRYNICIYTSITSYVLQKVFHCPLLCYFYANYGKFSKCGCLTWWLLQVKWEPYGNDLSHLPPSFRIEESNVWRSTVPLICFWLVEFHLLDRVLQQFGLKQEQPKDANTNRDLHKQMREERQRKISQWNMQSIFRSGMIVTSTFVMHLGWKG